MVERTPLRVGLIGTGWVSLDRHLPSIRRSPGAEVTAIYDRRPERAMEIARQAAIPHACGSLDQLLSSGVDAVAIATPPWTHAELAVTALDAGVHVFCEKPMAMNAAEAAHMAEAAGRARRLLTISHNFLFSRSMRKVQRFLDGAQVDYALGLQLSSFARRLPTWYGQLPGGLVFDECPHLVYLLSTLLGPLTLEHARAVPSPTRPEPSSIELLVRGRAPGQITMLMDSRLSEWQVIVTSQRGVAVVDLFRDIALTLQPDRAHQPLDILRTSSRAMADHVAGFVGSGMRYVAKRQHWGHDVLIGAFLDAARGLRPNPVPLDDALAVVTFVDAMLADLGLRGG